MRELFKCEINVQLKFILSIMLCAYGWSVMLPSYAQSPSSVDIPKERSQASSAKSLECSELINQLETKLFQSPNNTALMQAFKRAILLCQSTTKPQMHSHLKAPTPQSVTNATLTFGIGYHSNPEFVADYEQIELNFTDVSLSLINPKKVSPSVTQKMGLVLAHKRDTLSQKRQDEYQLNVSLQRFEQSNSLNQLFTGLRYGAFFQQKAFIVSYQHAQDALDSNVYGLVQLEGLWAQDSGALNRLRLGRTFYANAPVLEGTLIEVQHFFPKIPLSKQTNIQPILGVGSNLQVTERAGGNQWLWQAALGATTRWEAHDLSYGMRLALTQDVKKYSEILEKNTKRSLLNLNSYLKWRYRGLDTLKPDLTLSYVKQESNIDLFDWQFWEIALSVQIKW